MTPSPPRPPLAFRLGIVGHRPDRLPEASVRPLDSTVSSIVAAVEQAVGEVAKNDSSGYAPGGAALRAVTPLADGADRALARAIVARPTWQLVVPMPFPQDDFESDFTPASVAEFRELLGACEGRRTLFELDGRRDAAAAAYAAATRVVVNQSDLLIVVWDGEWRGRSGGTEYAIELAARRRARVVWIYAKDPGRWQVLAAEAILARRLGAGGPLQPAAGPAVDQVAAAVREQLDLPEASNPARPGWLRRALQWFRVLPVETAESPFRDLFRYYREHRPARSYAKVWPVFFWLVGGANRPAITCATRDFEEQAAEDGWSGDPSTVGGKVVNALRPFYAWPNGLSGLYATQYRSAFLLVYLLGAAAVALALVPFWFGLDAAEHPATVAAIAGAELACLLWIGFLVVRERAHSRHDRFLDCRLAAELVRHLRLVLPLGGARPFAHAAAHLSSYGEPAETWMDWLARAVARSFDLPNGRVNPAWLGDCLGELGRVLDKQWNYHDGNRERCHRVESRIQLVGVVLLVVTGVACLTHVLHLVDGSAGRFATFLCAVLPALGAALAGINNQGEFRRLAKRSRAMTEHIAGLQRERVRLANEVGKAARAMVPDVTAFAERAADLLVGEVVAWRVVILDRPLEPPA